MSSLLLFAVLAAASEPPAPPPIRMSAEECAVFRREASFAGSVDRHDAAAFAAHLHPGTVFNVGSSETARGAEAVLAAWAPLIAGEPVTLRWYPEVVHIGGEADIASSHGPYVLSQPGPDGKPVYGLGRYQSVWKKAADGQWYVLFDGGGAPARPIDQAKAEAVMAALPRDCPQA